MAGPRWRFGTFSFLLYSQRFIRGQVAGSEAKRTCSLSYPEKYSFSELLSGLKIAVLLTHLKCVEYTGPHIVHSHLLSNFALISAGFFYIPTD